MVSILQSSKKANWRISPKPSGKSCFWMDKSFCMCMCVCVCVCVRALSLVCVHSRACFCILEQHACQCVPAQSHTVWQWFSRPVLRAVWFCKELIRLWHYCSMCAWVAFLCSMSSPIWTDLLSHCTLLLGRKCLLISETNMTVIWKAITYEWITTKVARSLICDHCKARICLSLKGSHVEEYRPA